MQKHHVQISVVLSEDCQGPSKTVNNRAKDEEKQDNGAGTGSSTMTTSEDSIRFPPLQKACAEDRHYACGAKECSCKCHQKKPQARKGALLVVIGLLTLTGVLAWTLTREGGSKSSAKATLELNKSALKFVTSSLVEDLQVGLTGGNSGLGTISQQDLLNWSKLDAKVSASAYESAYDNNEIAADDQFKGKKLLVTGTVNRIEKDFTESGNIWLKGSGVLGIHAGLNDEGMAAAAALNPGQKVSLVCKGAGRLLTVADLSDCELLSNYLKDLSPSVESRVKALLEGGQQVSSSEAQLIALMYEVGTILPVDSPCVNSDLTGCDLEIDRLKKDPQTAQLLRTRTQNLLSSLNIK